MDNIMSMTFKIAVEEILSEEETSQIFLIK